MSELPPAQALYLGGERDPVSVMLHMPAGQGARDTGVVLCPPFGWDEICSYRSRRVWAEELAGAGYATVRVSLPSTGDSGGLPRDPGRVDAWTDAVAATARWLPTALGMRRVAAIGIGLGGLLAYRAAAGGAPIDDLVLWATPGRGRTLLRELRAFAKLEASQFFAREGEQPPPPPEGDLVAGGFLLSAETVSQLSEIDLCSLQLPASAWRRVLLLERDGITVDKRLHETLEGSGVSVTVAPGKGYSAMTAQPQQAHAPRELIHRVTSWLDEGSERVSSANAATSSAPVGSSSSANLQLTDDRRVKERQLLIPQPFGTLTGVLSEPLTPADGGLCAMLLNAGAIRQVGPSRMWVEAARRWAAQGVPTLRLDVEGIGDSDGDASEYSDDAGLYVPELTAQVLTAVEHLYEQGIGERFVLGGLCSGAYWAFHLALEDPRVVAALMVNPRALIWNPQLGPARDFRRAALRPSEWRKIRSASPARIRAVARWGLGAPRRLGASAAVRAGRRPRPVDELSPALDRLRQSGKRALLAFSGDEPLHRELTRSGHIGRLGNWPNITLELLPGRDHTLRPLFAQQRAHEALDRAIAREIELSRDLPRSERRADPAPRR